MRDRLPNSGADLVGQATRHLPILRTTGKVLIIVGSIDIAVMIYCILNAISYSSSLNIFAVVAGVFLLRGSLRAAALLRWFSVFLLAGVCALAMAWPFVQPLSLTLAQLSADPMTTATSVVIMLAISVLLFWVQRQLGKPPVVVALKAARGKVHDMRMPAAVGVCIVVLLAAVAPLALSGDSGAKALSLAQQQLGPGYQYHVSSLEITTNTHGTVTRATVMAWTQKEVRTVPVEWSE